MIRPWQMTNEIISDTKVIFTNRNAAIQFAPAAGSSTGGPSIARPRRHARVADLGARPRRLRWAGTREIAVPTLASFQ